VVGESSTLTVVVRAITGEFTTAMETAGANVRAFGQAAQTSLGPVGLLFGGTALIAGAGMFARALYDGANAASNLQARLGVLAASAKDAGVAFSASGLQEYIDGLATTTHGGGIAIDEMYAAYQRLNAVVPDQAEAQNLLKVAIDVSARSGRDLETVVQALVRAHQGNNRAILQYDENITKATAKTMSFSEIVNQLAKDSMGAAEAKATSLQGQIGILANQFHLAMEAVGVQFAPVLSEFIGWLGSTGIPMFVTLTNSLVAVGKAFYDLGRILYDVAAVAEHSISAMFDSIFHRQKESIEQTMKESDVWKDLGNVWKDFVTPYVGAAVGTPLPAAMGIGGIPEQGAYAGAAAAGPKTKEEFQKFWGGAFDITTMADPIIKPLAQSFTPLASIVRTTTTVFDIAKESLTKMAQSADVVTKWQNLTKTMLDRAGLTNFQEGLASGSPHAALLGLLMDVLMKTQSFADILKVVTDIVKVLASVIDAFLLPIIKLVAATITFVMNSIIDAINFLFGWLGIHIANLSNQFDTLATSTQKLIDIFNYLPTLNQLTTQFGGPGPGTAESIAAGVRANQATRAWTLGSVALGGSW
jgi:hypothetical protein